MRVAFYMTTVLEHGGGLEKYLIETAANLASRPGITADIITMDDNFTNRIQDALSVFYFKKIDRKLSYKEDIKDIRRSLKNARYIKVGTLKDLSRCLREYDVVYSKNELLEAFILKILIQYKNIPPVVFGGHTALKYPEAKSFHAKLHNFLYNGVIYKYLAGGVKKFHVLNDQEYISYTKLFSKHRVRKIYNPFDVEVFQKNALKNPYPLNLDSSELRVLWAGRLTEQKGVSDLIQIVKSVNAQHKDHLPKIVWTIVGDGELRQQVEQLADSSTNVNYLGHIDQKYMASIYKQHHFFLSTSKWEGYPYTLTESQAFGLQIIAYDIPGVNDIIKAYDGGNLVSGVDSMISFLTIELKKYKDSSKVPQSPPSLQFAPDTIYAQLINFLGITK